MTRTQTDHKIELEILKCLNTLMNKKVPYKIDFVYPLIITPPPFYSQVFKKPSSILESSTTFVFRSYRLISLQEPRPVSP